MPHEEIRGSMFSVCVDSQLFRVDYDTLQKSRYEAAKHPVALQPADREQDRK